MNCAPCAIDQPLLNPKVARQHDLGTKHEVDSRGQSLCQMVGCLCCTNTGVLCKSPEDRLTRSDKSVNVDLRYTLLGGTEPDCTCKSLLVVDGKCAPKSRG